MKRCWFGAGLLGVLLALSIGVTWAMDAIHAPISRQLSQAAVSAELGDWQRCTREFALAQEGWEKWAHFRACFADHTPVESVDSELAGASSAQSMEEWSDFAASCARASKMVASMGQAHALNWWNLL